ncbi:MAG: aldo/keto reductase, partial [Opitutaceae bacterium]
MNPVMLYPSAPALSPICLGGSTFGRENDESVAFTLMDYAVTRGITLIDTAATYTGGASERIVGAWRASRGPAPEQLGIATKIYPPYTPAAIDEGVAASAKRLGVET